MKDSSERGLGEGEGLENGLPQPFVESMRTLFDILDDQHTGRVKFSDIERRWHEDEDCGSSGLPAGVLDSLRVVTPLDGYLSFSRFCKGLQICLLRSKSGNPSLMPQMSSSNSNSLESNKSGRRSSGQTRVHSTDDDVPPPLPPPPPPMRDSSPPPLPYHSHPNNNNHSKKSSTSTTNNSNSYDHQKQQQQAITSNRQNAGSQPPSNNPRNPPWASHGGTGRSRQPLPPPQGTTNSSSRGSDAFNLDQFIQHASHRNALYDDSGANTYKKKSVTDAAQSSGGIIYQRSGSSDKSSRYDASASVDHYNNSNNVNIAAAQSRVNQYINSGGGTVKLPSPRKSSGSKSIRSSLSSEDILRDSSGDVAVSGSSYGRGGSHHHKTDIRMGTAGMMSLYGTKMSSSTTSSSHHGDPNHGTGSKGGGSGQSEGPPKPPRTLESQNSEGNLNSGSERKTSKTNSNSGDSSSVAHRVDSLINKMEALSSTYGTAASSKSYKSSNNVKQDKIYDRVSKSRPSSSGNSLGSSGKSLSGGNLLNGDRNLPPTSFSSSNHPSSSSSGSKYSSSATTSTGSHFGQAGSSGAPPPPVRGGGGMGGRAPATLPLSALNGYSLQRSQTHSHITTHSLERDSRTDARRPPPETVTSKMRTRRGGSLERLLDGHQQHSSNGVGGGGLPALPSYSHYHPHYNHHHHHSRESSADTTSTAPAFPYHWNTDWNTATNGQQQQRGQGHQQQQQHVSYGSGPHNKHGYQGTGGSKAYPNGSKSKGAGGEDMQNSSNENSPRRPSTALPSHAAAADHRLTMSSYAWIRGGDDSSGSDVNTNNNDHHHHLRQAPTGGGFTAPATAVTYAASSAHTATVTPTAALAASAAAGSDVDTATGGVGGGGVVMRGHRKGRRREARRHTLQNGLDYAAVRRAGELEAERDMLHQGLQVVEQARQWYRSQLHRLLASLHNPADPTQQPYDSEAQQQKLHYQLARITEINTQLSALMNASKMPHHLALATTTTAPAGGAGAEGTEEDKAKMESQVKRLRDQNQQLTEEVSQKSQHISALEQDKSRLLQELFQARAVSASMQTGGQADSTFM